MGRDFEGFVFCVDVDADISLLRIWRSQHSVLRIGVQGYEALGIGTGINRINEAELFKIVNIGSNFQYHNNPRNKKKDQNKFSEVMPIMFHN